MKIRLIFLAAAAGLMLASGSLAQSADRTYSDTKIRFSYPADFVVVKGARAANDTAFGDPGEGTKMLAVRPKRIPAKYHGGYEFNIWTSKDTAKCGAVVADETIGLMNVELSTVHPTRDIGAATFNGYAASDGGMSKSMELGGYRAVVGGKCWMIQSMTYQVSAYDDFKPLSGKIIDEAFEKFVSSLRFLNK